MNYFAEFDQVIIYGANGWLGRSTIGLAQENELAKLLLIGSKASEIWYRGQKLPIYTSGEAIPLIKENAIFFNFAFLRKEKILTLGLDNFSKLNLGITTFAIDAIKTGKIEKFINSSSGVAAQAEQGLSDEPYAKQKFDAEILLANVAQKFVPKFINCRIFSIMGSDINEFQNLAISSFITQAQHERKILVKNPDQVRTYVLDKDLVSLLAIIKSEQNFFQFDSGGEKITMLELADTVSRILGDISVKFAEPDNPNIDYLGDYLGFNKLASNHGIELKNIEYQVQESLKAFPKVI